MPKREDTRPAHKQVAATLRAQIMAGELQPGDKLPSNPQLVEQTGAANPTIQRATTVLKGEGYLWSHPGKGVFVRERRARIVECGAYFDPATTLYSYSAPDVSEVQPPADVAEALGEDRAVLRKRLLLHEDEPVEISWSYYPASIASGTALAARRKIKGGAPAVLSELGLAEHDYVDRISVRQPTTEEVELLDLPEDVPVIRQFRTIHAADGQVVEVTIMVKGGHLNELLYRQPVAD